jgi:diguanylate cyclase (GGDEF)-like protein/PAS domain S-box-containing protein
LLEPDEPAGLRKPRRPVVAFLTHAGVRRPVAAVSLALAALALAAGAITVVQFGDQTAREADRRLARHVDDERDAIESLLVHAKRDLRLARRNPALEQALLTAPADLPAEDLRLVDRVLTYMGDRYAVDEICLIRADGQELARWDHGQIAATADLSPDESINNPAFGPTMRLPDDAVHQTDPYISPDTARWVVGLATPVVLDDGQRLGILHFEIPIQWFVDELAAGQLATGDVNLLLDRDGRLLAHPDIAAFRRAAGLPIDATSAPFPPAVAKGSPSWKEAIEQALQSADGHAIYAEGGRDYRLEFRAIPATPWIVATSISMSALYADVERARLNLLITVGPLIVLMVFISGRFATRLAASNGRLAAASRASSQLASIVESADDAILSVDADGRIATWNAGASSMYGLSAGQVVGQGLDVLSTAIQSQDLPRLLDAVMAGEPIERYETVHRKADGSVFHVWLTLSPIRHPAGSTLGVSVIARDISDQKRLEDELAHQALHDSLTGLPNRALFRDRLSHSLLRGRTGEQATTGRHAILFVDLDDFKVINDTLGHRVGDQLLIAVAARLREIVREADTAARLGGDEFTVLFENIEGQEDVERAAERMIAEFRKPFEVDGHQIVVSASIGIAFGAAGVDNPDDLLRCADIALYEAKGQGKGRHEIYQQAMNTRAWRRLEMERELRLAIARQELRVYYQPIVDLQSGLPVEVEALVRWAHPERGLILPGEFVPVAEQAGLIVPIGRFVLETACRQLAAWQRKYPAAADLALSINVSPRELVQPGFAASVAAVQRRHRLARGRLKLEITESATLEGAATIETLRALHNRGIRISIDDFGTGYSSLGYFRELPIDGLKIDRAFIDGLGVEREDTAIVTAAIAFATALDVEVTAEGVETSQQMERLRELGCQLAQGFLFSRPVPAIELGLLLNGEAWIDVA